MKLRNYIGEKDFSVIQSWSGDDRMHTLWCANHFQYPLDKGNFEQVLEKNKMDWNDSVFVATDDCGKQVGFACLATNYETNSGYFKYVIIDSKQRGQGYGEKMINLLITYARNCACLDSVALAVYATNIGALRCYEKAGFTKVNESESNVFSNETWRVFRMKLQFGQCKQCEE